MFPLLDEPAVASLRAGRRRGTRSDDSPHSSSPRCVCAAFGCLSHGSQAQAQNAYGQAWGGTYTAQDWNRFYHYPYVYYPQNFWGNEYYRSADSLYYRYPPEMRIPVYNRRWHNEYPNRRKYHAGPPLPIWTCSEPPLSGVGRDFLAGGAEQAARSGSDPAAGIGKLATSCVRHLHLRRAAVKLPCAWGDLRQPPSASCCPTRGGLFYALRFLRRRAVT